MSPSSTRTTANDATPITFFSTIFFIATKVVTSNGKRTATNAYGRDMSTLVQALAASTDSKDHRLAGNQSTSVHQHKVRSFNNIADAFRCDRKYSSGLLEGGWAIA